MKKRFGTDNCRRIKRHSVCVSLSLSFKKETSDFLKDSLISLFASVDSGFYIAIKSRRERINNLLLSRTFFPFLSSFFFLYISQGSTRVSLYSQQHANERKTHAVPKAKDLFFRMPSFSLLFCSIPLFLSLSLYKIYNQEYLGNKIFTYVPSFFLYYTSN